MINLTNSYEEMTGLIADVRVMAAIYRDLSKSFNTVFYKIVIERSRKYDLDEQTLR